MLTCGVGEKRRRDEREGQRGGRSVVWDGRARNVVCGPGTVSERDRKRMWMDWRCSREKRVAWWRDEGIRDLMTR